TMKRFLSIVILILAGLTTQGQSISEIQGQGGASPFDGQVVTTTGIVTASFVTGGNPTSAYFLQDGTGQRSGIYVYDGNFSPAVGDEIEITATVDEFFELTELVDVTELTVLSSGNDLPAPAVISTAEANSEDFESVLVRIESGLCTNDDIGFGEFEINDGSGPLAVDDLIYLFQASEGINYQITAPVYFSFGTFKLVPSSPDDITIADDLFFTSFPTLTSIGTNELEIIWSTNVASSSEIEYGETDGYELGTIEDETETIDHSVILDGLDPATIYYLNINAEGSGSSTSYEFVVSTASESTGEIKVYFNHVVDVSVATDEEAVYAPSIRDTIISYIDSANHTIDVTMYDVENEEIIAALNEAADRGVAIRYITDEGTENPVLEQLSEDIPLLAGNLDGLMHNKFWLFDREIVDSCWVMTGSTNHTEANLGWDFNNLICIQDQSLARAYTLEFDEMWGSSESTPNLALSRFGVEKQDNTPHQFIIDGIETELYFSPSDGVTNKIAAALSSAEESIDFATLVFTENALGNAIADAHNAGLDVQGIIDYVEFNGSEFDFLLGQGVDVMDYQNADGSQWPDGPTLHHKYAIVDRDNLENATLVTGSHNWSASANSIHDENTLIMKSARLANLYYQEFSARFYGMFTSTEDLELVDVNIYPNPSLDMIFIRNSNDVVFNKYQITDLQGRVIDLGILRSNQIYVNELPEGIYLLNLIGEEVQAVKKIIVYK
ncbi:MAG: phospholipase D-like domain-containing protein, partial [Bacteroidota bacterium]